MTFRRLTDAKRKTSTAGKTATIILCGEGHLTKTIRRSI
jgi:hypothetical protein